MDTRAPITPDQTAEIARRLAAGFDLEAFAAFSQALDYGGLARLGLALALLAFLVPMMFGVVPRPPRATRATTGASALLLLLSALAATPIAWPMILAPITFQLLLWAIGAAIAGAAQAVEILGRIANFPALAALRVRVGLALATPAFIGATAAATVAGAAATATLGALGWEDAATLVATATIPAGTLFGACLGCARRLRAPRRFGPSA